ncbi:base plate tail tube protein [Vibrio phage vB_VpS_PG07]|uniref:Minor tail protein n=1 Tax=Vibrio phage vB_VpS_PG07 TaxID=2301664 RepID=A0A385E7C3_9CAUD|nr:base plate tail tube protein [Vibrio phage vB_VpS_PG07]AXQ66757.1 minor tail protein [Vibrio phage vB_VpS_PG07]
MASRQLLRNALVVIVYEGRSYTYQAASSISLETSFTEVSGRRKTLFKKVAKKYSIISEKASTTVQVDLVATDGRTEELLFKLIGLSEGPLHRLPDSIPVSPEYFDVYLTNTEVTIKLSPCFLETIDVFMSKDSPLGIGTVFNAASFEYVDEMPQLETSPQGLPLPLTPIYLGFGEQIFNNVVNASFSIQQVADWRQDKSLFTPGIYSRGNAILEDLIVSATITTNLDTNGFFTEPTIGDFYVKQNTMSLSIDSASIIPRNTIGTVYQNNLDVSPVEESGDVIIQYGEKR